jgi:hypothetical protein
MMTRPFWAAVAVSVCVSVGGCGIGRAEDPARALSRAKASLVTARSGIIWFDVNMGAVAGAGVAMTGTAKRRFGSPPAVDTSYTRFKIFSGTSTPGPDYVNLHTILVGNAYYQSGLGIAGDRTRPAETPWIKSDVAVSANGPIDPSGAIATPEATVLDPQIYFNLAACCGGLAAGSEKMGKVSTEEYDVDCNFSATHGCDLATLGRLGQYFPNTQSAKLSLWLDGQDRPRKLTVDAYLVNQAFPEEAKVQELKLTMTFADFGKSIQIVAPPPSQVYHPCKGEAC